MEFMMRFFSVDYGTFVDDGPVENRKLITRGEWLFYLKGLHEKFCLNTGRKFSMCRLLHDYRCNISSKSCCPLYGSKGAHK